MCSYVLRCIMELNIVVKHFHFIELFCKICDIHKGYEKNIHKYYIHKITSTHMYT